MSSDEEIKAQQELLYAYRRTLFALLKQRALITASFVPPAIANGIDEARDNIRRIKQILRAMGVSIDDLQYDEEAPLPQPGSIGGLPPSSTNIARSSNIGWYMGAFGLLIALVALGAVGYVLISNRARPTLPSVAAVSSATVPTTVSLSPPSAAPTAIPTIKPTVEPAAEPAVILTETPVPPPPVPTNRPTVTPVLIRSQVLEAEKGELGNGAYVDNPEPSASNGRLVNMHETGEIKFTTGDLVAGQYQLVVRYYKYSNQTPDYPLEGYEYLYVNNDSNAIPIRFMKTFGDNEPIKGGDTSVTIFLEQGANTLTIKAITDSKGGSIDYISISLIN